MRLMMRAIALIDGEHYPPVVRFALEQLSAEYEVLGAVFVGGTEKVDAAASEAVYGLPVVTGADRARALVEAIDRFAPEVAVDLSDEPVLSAPDRMELAGIALGHGVQYRGADFAFTPPAPQLVTQTTAISIIGTGKRVGKTAVSAHFARYLKAKGRDIVVLAMGRGGPDEPELIHGEQVALTTEDLCALARRGVHASSDNYEDAVMSRVTTVGCRRCGGGLAGETFFSNVAEGARLADSLGKEIIVLEGSGSAIPPVAADATLLVVSAAQGVSYVRDFFGPYRLRLADAVIVAGAEEPMVSASGLSELTSAIRAVRDDVPVVPVTFRPRPLADVAGARVLFATTAPSHLLPLLSEHLESEFGCEVVMASPHLSDRVRLREDIAACAGKYDLLLTELKAAAIDVAAAAVADAGVPTVLCDNEPASPDPAALVAAMDRVVRLSTERHDARSR
ncbi:MAG: 2,3-diphosphoglycerate synthetase [Coriobacteriia bacterium]|nr:2,3-diphosphoglycerate synthetase [Coriobacteriia bacterium]